jgi:nitrite reductase/ring-hydroxylating ferredoxin subunit/uncharacterized membrane protein
MTKQATTLSSLFEGDTFAWLDKVAEPLQQSVSTLFRTNSGTMKLKSMLNGTPLRHRAHPAVIIWPLGAWTTAALLDVLDAKSSGRKRVGYRTSADSSIAFGIVGSLPAAMTGMADWVDLSDHHRRVGTAHAVLNSVALVCYSTSYALRMANPRKRGAAWTLAGIGYGALMVSGALGGELVYTLGTNVPHTIYPKPPNEFRDALPSAELTEGTPVVVEIERIPVLLLRRDGQIHAVQEWCPHAGGPLSEGTFDGDIVECPWHQSRFCLADGAPKQGPATVPLRTFDVREQAGMIQVRPSYEAQSWPPPPEPPRSAPQHVQLQQAEQ